MFKRNRGFTLAELLIVVAIVAVLVAIAIPVFFTQMEKSREATDAANIRSLYAEVIYQAVSTGTDANMDGALKVTLCQSNDNWQNTQLEDNLNSLMTEVIGSPAAGGTAWVTRDNTGTRLYYSGGGTPDPDPTVPDTPTDETDYSGNTYHPSIDLKDGNILTFNSPVATQITITVYKGNSYNGGSYPPQTYNLVAGENTFTVGTHSDHRIEITFNSPDITDEQKEYIMNHIGQSKS